MSKLGRFIKKSYLAIILLFLYLPIGVLIVQSFNTGKSRAKWEGFSFHWYADLFKDRAIMEALQVTLGVAVLAAIISTILGTLAAIGIHSMKKRPQAFMMTLTNIPNTMPDIVTGISLMLLFIFTKVERGFVKLVGALPQFWHDGEYHVRDIKCNMRNEHADIAVLYGDERKEHHQRNTRHKVGVDHRQLRDAFDCAAWPATH